MEKIKLIIADPDERFTDFTASALKLYPEIELVAIENNGTDAFQKVKSLRPDALLFDVLLPGIDGISLLRSVNELYLPPATICCTRFFSDITMEAMRTHGASYMMFKPIDPKALCNALISSVSLHKRLRNYTLSPDPASIESDALHARVRNYVISLGISAKLAGCAYLTEAVLFALEDITLTRNLSRGLYHEIAHVMQTTPSCVERSIRNAVSTAYSSRKLPESFISCPSNKEFIKYILQNLTLNRRT